MCTTKDPDTKKVVVEAPSNRLHGVQYNLELFHNRTLFTINIEAAEEIYERLGQKARKVLKSELAEIKANPPTDFPALMVSPVSAPILYTEGMQLASDRKRGIK